MVAMGRLTKLDVLLALVGSPVTGDVVNARLASAGKQARTDALLAQLLRLEASGHVAVTRGDRYEFSLTPLGREATADLAPGDVALATLVMLDLVGFVPFTVANGDAAAQHSADLLHAVAHMELSHCGGRVVKTMGDGLLALASPDGDAVGAAAAIAQRMAAPDAGSWRLRAAVHSGAPMCVRDDVYGHDVNVVARLCSVAEPDEVVVSAPGAADAEWVSLRGVADPVPVIRLCLVGA